MELEYYVGKHDAVAFAQFHAGHSRRVGGQLRAVRILGGLVFVVLALIWLLLDVGLYAVVLFFAIGVIWVIVFPAIWRWRYSGQVSRMYDEGHNRSLVGRHTLRLEDDALYSASEVIESKIKWPAVEKIEAADDYTFVYISALSALVIPRASVTSGDYEAFVKALRDRHARTVQTP